MRTYLDLVPTDGTLTLPVHYSDIVQGFIYRAMGDTSLSSHVHDYGVRTVDGKPAKLFAFSRLTSDRFTIDRHAKTITFVGIVRLVVTSALDEMIYDLTTSLLKEKRITLNGRQLTVRQARIQAYSGTVTQTQIRCLSPITVYRTLTQSNGRKFTQYYKPGTDEFNMLLRQNLAFKSRALGHDATIEDIELEITPVVAGAMRERILLFHGSPIHAWEGDFRIQGTARELELAWNAGLGAKGSAGFGVVEVFAQGR